MSTSVWNTVKGESKELSFWKWPNPFNAIKRVDVLACNPNWLARVEFYTHVSAEFFYTNFVPSPSEILRNWFLGNYDCGKKAKTSLNQRLPKLPGKDARVIFAELARGPLTLLFYWWAAQTTYSALDTYSTVLNAQIACDADTNEGILRDGFSTLGGIAEGSPVFGQTVYDPNGWMLEPNCAANAPAGPKRGIAMMTFVNVLAAGGIQWEAWMDVAGEPQQRVGGTLALNETVSVVVGAGANTSFGFQPRYAVLNDIPEPFGRLECFMTRFYFWAGPGMDEDPPWPLWNPEEPTADPFNNCLDRFKSDYNPSDL